MVAFPSSPSVGQQFQLWTWDGVKWAPSPQSVPHCGRLILVGSNPGNSISFAPFNGDLIKLNGVIRQLPVAGLTAVANSCYVNGVLGALAPSTLYYVYVFDSGNGVLALDFSPTVYELSTTPANSGVARKTGDDTRSFVGKVFTTSTAPSSNSFTVTGANVFVRSWFNRQALPVVGAFTSWGPTSAQSWTLAYTSPLFLAYADETVYASFIGWWYTGDMPAGLNAQAALGINGSALGFASQFSSWTAGALTPLALSAVFQAGSQGVQTLQFFVMVGPSGGNFSGSGSMQGTLVPS